MRTVILAFVLLLGGCAGLAPAAPAPAPAEAAASRGPTGRLFVAAANPLAAEAGMAVLRRGGSAVDAAVAVQAVLGLVEPQSSGLGGGAFLVHFDGETGAVTAWDGRETAPAGAGPDLFLDEAGEPLPFREAVLSGRSTGVPGAVAMLAAAHRTQGRLPWAELFGDAERLAREGFIVSPRLAGFISGATPQALTPDATAYFTGPDGERLQAGDRLVNPAYAETVRRLAQDGPAALYGGPVGAAVVASAGREPRPGTLSQADLTAYAPRSGPALCAPYRVVVVCTAAPPSSGVSLLQLLRILEGTDIAAHGPDEAEGWALLLQAQRLMYADRDRWVADPAFVEVPVEGLLDPAYAAERRALIGERAGPAPEAGTPPGASAAVGEDATIEAAGTSHFVVIDARGDVVSMTTSVESVFGSGRMAGGFFLNNQLTDFSFAPAGPDGAPAANAVAAGKRPRSSMSPVVVLDRDGRFLAALGSPGGPAILAYNAKTLVAVLDWGLDVQAAIDLPNLVVRGGRFTGEADGLAPGVVEALAARGFDVGEGRSEISGLHGVRVLPDGRLDGGADRRREGVVLVEPARP